MILKIFSLLIVQLLLVVAGAAAQSSGNPFERDCGYYNSSEEFVRAASYYCLKQANTRRCDKQAGNYFRSCNFAGNFSAISNRVNTSILMLYLIGNTPPFLNKQERHKAGREARSM